MGGSQSSTESIPTTASVPTTAMSGGVSGNDLFFSHHASLQLRDSPHADFCAAAVIHSLLIVTSASCATAYNIHKIRAMTGRRSLSAADGTEVRKICHIITHEQYNGKTFLNDIALLVLDQPLHFDDYTRPIQTLGGSAGRKQGAFLSHWGRGQQYDTIQRVPATLVDQEECRFKMNGLGPNVTDSMLCARVDSSYCTLGGDPLVCDRASISAERYLCGITSWGVHCSHNSSLPDVFTDVSKYHNWIADHMKQVQSTECETQDDYDYHY